jgi:hypothetical protein
MNATRTHEKQRHLEQAVVATSAHAQGIVGIGLGIFTLLIRLLLHGRSFDLFGDEVIYTDLGRSVMSGGFPRFYGQIFFLHGPGFFYLEAGWSRLFGTQPGLIAWVYEMRILNALLAGVTALVIVHLASRASSLKGGVVAGLLFALDPFCIRQNDRVLLETAMMLFVLLGYFVFSSLVLRSYSRWDWARAVLSGLLFGCAILIKDEAALLSILPMLGVLTARIGASRFLALITIVSTGLVYATYVGVVAANGHMSALWEAKTTGVKRLLGVVQVTGFHSSGGGSLSSRLVAEGGYFVTTYLLLAIAVPALVVLLRHGGSLQRLLGLLHCAAAATLAYAVTLGTLEEQELYLLVVPSLLTVSVVSAGLVDTRKLARRATSVSRRNRRMIVMTAMLAVVIVLNVSTCLQWATHPDDGFSLLLPYMAKHVPLGTAVTVAAGSPPPSQTDGGRYALEGRYKTGLWVTPHALRQERVRYIMVEWGPIDEGYSYLNSSQVHALIRHYRRVFSYRGRTYGDLSLYRVP